MSDIQIFEQEWECKLKIGMQLEILDKSDWDVYECKVTKLENGKIYILRDDKEREQLV